MATYLVVNQTTGIIDNAIDADPLNLPVIPGYDIIADNGQSIGDIYSANYTPAPGPYFVWNPVTEEWDFDDTAFNTAVFGSGGLLDMFRDEQIASEMSLVTSVYNTETLGLLADARTLEAVGRKVALAPVINTDTNVQYKFKQFTPATSSDSGYRLVDKAFLAKFYILLDAKNQSFFDAEKATIEENDSTQFMFVQDVYDFYLEQL